MLSDALTRFEAPGERSQERREVLSAGADSLRAARIIAARQIEFFSPIVEPVRAQSATEPRRMLMIGLITAGSAVLFGAAMFARKMMA